MLSQHIPLCVGRSLGKEVDIDGRVSELPPVVVVPEGVGTCVHTALHRLSWETANAALGRVTAVLTHTPCTVS